jgi:hypothetical protein
MLSGLYMVFMCSFISRSGVLMYLFSRGLRRVGAGRQVLYSNVDVSYVLV